MSIREIRSVVEIISSKVSPLKNFFYEIEPETKLFTLYKGIESKKWETDEEAAAELYGSGPGANRYQVLRNKLMEECVASLPLFDYSQRFSKLAAKNLEFQRTLSAITILLHAGLSTIANRLTKRLLKEATLYEITATRLSCVRILREDALYEGNIPAMEEYREQFNALLELYNAELHAEGLCQEVEAHFINSTAQKQEVADKAFEYEDYLRRKNIRLGSSTLELYRYRLLLYALQISGRFSEAVQVSIEAKKYLISKPLLNSRTRQVEFSLCAMDCSIMLREYEDALHYGLQCLSHYTRGRRNWYLVANSAFLCAMHSGGYELAVDLYTKAIEYSGFENLPPFEQNKWNLYQAYLSLFFSMGIIHSDDKKIRKMFRVGNSLKVVMDAFKDKKGLNIPLQVLHIVYYIHTKDFELASAKIDAFSKYAQLHLSETEHTRTLIFLNMLKVLRKKQFDACEAHALTGPLYQELLLSPLKQQQFVETNEIMPYDKIWQWITGQKPESE